MNSEKVKRFIAEKLEGERRYSAPQIFKDLSVNIYNLSFGAISIEIKAKYGRVCGYVGNYEAIAEKVSEFICRSHFNLYERYYWAHHKRK